MSNDIGSAIGGANLTTPMTTESPEPTNVQRAATIPLVAPKVDEVTPLTLQEMIM